jgi:acetylornithine deacetylase/succinyl-diaminopimelate desuccinylase-like protein
VCIISDGSMPSVDTPTIVYSVRGLVGFEIVVHGPATDLHSGMFGGTVHNPIQALAEIIARLHNDDGSVNVPGFYDDVQPLTEEERRLIASGGGYTFEQWQAKTGAPAEWGEQGYTINERIGARPTLEITGIAGGYAGQGLKNVIPARAVAKGSARLVANQDPARIYELIKAQIERLAPPTVRVEVHFLASGLPARVDVQHPMMQAAVNAYRRGWGHEPVFKREGGSLPVVADLTNHVGMPVLMVGYGLDTDGIHGPNEHYDLNLFHKGIETSIHFLASGLPARVDVQHPMMQAAVNAYRRGWGHEPVFKREGGSLPVVADLTNHVGMPVLMVGYGLDTDGIHGPNEHYDLNLFHKGIETSIHFLYEVSQL